MSSFSLSPRRLSSEISFGSGDPQKIYRTIACHEDPTDPLSVKRVTAAATASFSGPLIDKLPVSSLAALSVPVETTAMLQRTREDLALGEAEEGTPRPLLTARAREYRVRQTIERRDPCNPTQILPNRFEHSLQRAKAQMESQARSPGFHFQIPPRVLEPTVDGSAFTGKTGFVTQELVVGGMNVGISSDDNGRFRSSMEDSHIAVEFIVSLFGTDFPCSLFGVFDGHGGDAASSFVSKNIQTILQQLILTHNQQGLSEVGIYNALKLLGVQLSEAFNLESSSAVRLSKAFDHEYRTPQTEGTTLIASVFINGDIYVVNIGDSRAVLDLNGTPVQLSEDQKSGDPYYEKIIRKRGGCVHRSYSPFGIPRVNGTLATARAIGDADCRPEFSVSARSKITRFPLREIPEGTHLVLISDGVTDVANTVSIVRGIHENRERSSADLSKGLVYSALQSGSKDNATAIVVRIR